MTQKRATKKSKSSSPTTWILSSQTKLAEFFHVSPRTIDSWRRSGMPGSDRKWDVQKIVYWLRTAGPWRPRAAHDDDPLMAANTDSKWLEEYRKERALLARLDREEREGTLVNLEIMREVHGLMAEMNRRTCRKLETEFGHRAREIYVDGLKACERAGEKYFAGIKQI